MNNSADTLSEQLSAFMDGELPEAEARFLQRRLEHDAELRKKWSRLHLAAACLKGHPVRLMTQIVSDGVDAGIGTATATRAHRPLLRWAMAASVAALAVLFAPQLMRDSSPEPAGIVAGDATPAVDYVIASPASADLVAVAKPIGGAESRTGLASAPPRPAAPDFINRNPEASAKSSPMPLSVTSPSDFPLLDSGEQRAWPRSELIGAQADPTIEAYLVRHNQMLAHDGLGGFVPYVDVVASDPAAASPTPDATDSDADADAGASQP
jgi:anti-sigma factor RsiW